MKTFKIFTVIILSALLLIICSEGRAYAANGGEFSRNDLSRMSEFVSEFTMGQLTNFKASDIINSKNKYPLLEFAFYKNVRHFTYCYQVNCAWSGRVEKKYVDDTIKKLFNYDIKPPQKILEGNNYVTIFDGKFYYASLGDPAIGSLMTAKVEKAVRKPSGEILMTGSLYFVEENLYNGTFEALARPHKFKGQDTWYIISLSSKTLE